MNFIEYLKNEWVPTLGCTEPACIAYAGLTAAAQLKGDATRIKLIVDPRIYKNCYAVGIPHSGHKNGIKWTTALGAFLGESRAKLECFKDITESILKKASRLINSNSIEIIIDKDKANLYVDFSVSDGKNSSRCVIENTHTNITHISLNKKILLENKGKKVVSGQNMARKWAASLSIKAALDTVKKMPDSARRKIHSGMYQNLKIAEHGLTLFPAAFINMISSDLLTRCSGFVCSGVYARMSGEDFPVISIAGSGNKGITISVPITLLEKEWRVNTKKMEEALGLAMIFTSKTTEELGTLSAVCGCSNAAGIGLACALVYLQGGGEKEISFAINNMVGNVTGMICDGAKIGCALKTMTAVDSAFRAATLAINGIGIPYEDGIVGRKGQDSLKNMGKIARLGMTTTDEEILKIMKSKLNESKG